MARWRFAVYTIAALLLIIGLNWAIPARPETPPYHKEVGEVITIWRKHDVSGYLLVSPEVDSLGHHLSMMLPPGATLLLPRVVRDSIWVRTLPDGS